MLNLCWSVVEFAQERADEEWNLINVWLIFSVIPTVTFLLPRLFESYVICEHLVATASPTSMNLVLWVSWQVYSSMEKKHHSISLCWKVALDRIMLRQRGSLIRYLFFPPVKFLLDNRQNISLTIYFLLDLCQKRCLFV